MILDSFNKFSECSGSDKNNKHSMAVIEMLIPFLIVRSCRVALLHSENSLVKRPYI